MYCDYNNFTNNNSSKQHQQLVIILLLLVFSVAGVLHSGNVPIRDGETSTAEGADMRSETLSAVSPSSPPPTVTCVYIAQWGVMGFNLTSLIRTPSTDNMWHIAKWESACLTNA